MSRTKTAKFIALDILQWGAYASPVFVTGTITAFVKSTTGSEYWLLVSLIVGYVAAATLLVWIPVKLTFQWMRLLKFQRGKWCPGMALFVILSALPCTVMLLVDTKSESTIDFHAHCVELLVVMLVVTDLTEKLKRFKLRSNFDPESSGMMTEIAETTGQEYQASESNYSVRRRSDTALVSRSGELDRPSLFVWVDPRPWILMRCVLNAYDVRLVLELAHDTVTPNVSTTNWIFAIYIIALSGMATFVLKPKCRYSPLVTVAFLEIPFFFLRFAYLCHYGHVISILFFLKNLLAAGSFIYFNVVRVLFGRTEASFGPSSISVNTVDRTLPNGTLGMGNPNYPTSVRANGSAYGGGSHTSYRAEDQFNYQTYRLDDHAPAEDLQQPQQHHDNDDHEFDLQDENHQQYDQHQYGYNDEDEQYGEDGYYNWKRKSPHRDTVLRSDLYASPEEDHHQQHQDYQLQQYGHESDAAGHVSHNTDALTSHDELPADEPTYSSVNRKAKAESRKKKAPPVPTPQRKHDSGASRTSQRDRPSSAAQRTSYTGRADEPGMKEIQVGPQRVSVRKDLSYTPALASQIAKEAYSAVAKDAVAELDNVVMENIEDDYESSASSYNARL